MAATARYAVVTKVANRISGFLDNAKLADENFVYLVDVSTHNQKDEIEIKWFYDKETDTFSATGEVPRPEEKPTQMDIIEGNQTVIESTQLVMMEAMADQYEQQQEQNLINMEAQATIYETLLEMQGV